MKIQFIAGRVVLITISFLGISSPLFATSHSDELVLTNVTEVVKTDYDKETNVKISKQALANRLSKTLLNSWAEFTKGTDFECAFALKSTFQKEIEAFSIKTEVLEATAHVDCTYKREMEVWSQRIALVFRAPLENNIPLLQNFHFQAVEFQRGELGGSTQ